MNLFQHTGSKWAFKNLMSFVDFTVFNSSGAQIDNINAGGVDVPAGSSVTATLDGTELLAVCALNNVAVMQNGASAAERAAVAELLIDLAADGGAAAYALDPTSFSAIDAAAIAPYVAAGDELVTQMASYISEDKDAAVAAWVAL